MIRSQNDVYMVVNNNGAEINSNGDNTEASVEAGTLTVGELQRAAKNICTFILDSAVINRPLVELDKAEEHLAKADASYDVQKLSDSDKVKLGDKEKVSFEVEEDGEYTVIVNIMSPMTNLSQSTCNVHINGEVAFVIQTNGTDGNWILQKLVKLKLNKGMYDIELEHVMTGIEVAYIQFKKITNKK